MTLDKPEMRGTFSFTEDRKPLFDFGEIIKDLKAQVKELEAYKKDVENACKMAMDEKCSLDQKHCTCVPLLRLKVRELEKEKRELESEFVLSNTILEAIEKTLEGKEPDDFMQSFGIVRQVFDMKRRNEWLEHHVFEGGDKR